MAVALRESDDDVSMPARTLCIPVRSHEHHRAPPAIEP